MRHLAPSSVARPVRRTPAFAAGLAALALAATSLGGPATAAPPSQELKPAKLPAGAQTTVPYFDGSTLVAGETTIETKLRGHAEVLGTNPEGEHLVSAQRPRGVTVAWVSPESNRVVLRTKRPFTVVASTDLSRVVLSTHRQAATVIRVHTTTDGNRVAARKFRGFVQVPAAAPKRVLVSRGEGGPQGTWWWRIGPDRTRKISPHRAFEVALPYDRMALLEGDPYQGYCQRVVRVSAPRKTIWRSCEERVEAFSPSGRMATVDLLSDGLGPTQVIVRRPGGRAVKRYHTPGWFADIAWEGKRALIVHAVGTKRAAYVRCLPKRCERASELKPRPNL